MENKKFDRSGVLSNYRRKINEYMEKFPQEDPSNHRMVSMGSEKKLVVHAWQPHNYRLYFDFDKRKFKPPSKQVIYKTLSSKGNEGKGLSFPVEYFCRNYGSEHHFHFRALVVKVRKESVEVINNTHMKQWRRIAVDGPGDAAKIIDGVIEKMDDECVQAVRLVMRWFGGRSDLRLLKRRIEQGVHGDEFLDSIPADMIIHDTHFKKVYDRKVEFKSVDAVKNFISNRAVEKIAPEIAEEIAKTRVLQEELFDVLRQQAEINKDTATNLDILIKSQLPKKSAEKESVKPERPFYVG